MRRTSSKERKHADQSTFLSEDLHAKPSVSPDSAADWLTRAATSRSDILQWLMHFGPAGWSTRTSPASYPQLPTSLPIHVRRLSTWTATTDPLTGLRSWSRTNTTLTKTMRSPVSWPDFQNSGIGGPSQVLTLNTSTWRNGASVCSLWGILERGNLPQRYYLTPKACVGILRRAVNRGKELPALLMRALKAVADLGRTSILGGGFSLAPPLTASGRGVTLAGETRGQDCMIPVPWRLIPVELSNGDVSHCLNAGVRRLTPIETSRLQGFPDTYAHIPRRSRKIEPDESAHYLSHGIECWCDGEQWFTKVAADGSIYRSHGNSMAVPVMRWIGERIKAANAIS